MALKTCSSDDVHIIGDQCQKIGADSDDKILREVLSNFEENIGVLPTAVIYDRGGDGPVNHQLIKEKEIRHNCIFRKGQEKMDVGPKIYAEAKRERALSEAVIAVIKHPKYGFTRPRAKSADGCTLKGHMAILGANLNKFVADLVKKDSVAMDIG
jgi:hypothetical protein